MYTKFRLAALSAVVAAKALGALAQGSAFTYQGRLNDNGAPANGVYDIRIALYDAALNGNGLAGPLTNCSTAISNGLFTSLLDFGADVFDGNPRWLELAVRTNGGGDFVILAPRQPLAPNPYALYARSAGSANSIAATNLVGSVALGQLSSPVLTNGQTGVSLAGAFAGDGGSLTNLANGPNSPGILLDYPHVGPARTQYHKVTLDPPGAVLYLPAGSSGIVRSFWVVPAGDSSLSPSSATNLSLRVYVDAGTIADVQSNPPSANLVVDAPLNVLLGRVYRAPAIGIRETRFLDATESDTTWQSFFVKFPMLFTNGVLITLWNKALGSGCTNAFSYAAYELGPVGPYANWRFRSQYARATRQTGSLTLLQVHSKPGMVVGICQSLLGPSPPLWLEAPLSITTDNGEWAASGGEDIFLNPGYFAYGVNTQHYYGTLYTNLLNQTNFIVEAYRWWDRDAVCWTNDVTATLPLPGLGAVGQTADILTFYYSP